MPSNLPRSKRKLRKKYHIPNKDFRIVVADSEPKPEPGTLLERVANWKETVPTWLRRHKLGVVAVIVLFPVVKHEVKEDFQAYVETAHEIAGVVKPFSQLPHLPFDSVLRQTRVGTTSNTAIHVVTMSVNLPPPTA